MDNKIEVKITGKNLRNQIVKVSAKT